MLTVQPAAASLVEPAVDDRGDEAVPPSSPPADQTRIRRSVLAGGIAGLVPYLAVLCDVGWDPLRRADPGGFASNFYDVQARALLDGHLAVPDQSLGIEGFVVDGRTYMYFPPFPSLLRLPLLAVTDRFDGRLSAPMMLLAWLLLVAATAALVWNVRRLLRGDAAVTRVEAVLAALFIAAVSGGSVVLFLAALPWVYHEAYLWATAAALTALAGLVAFARRPTTGVAALTGAAATATILSRTTTGWAIAVTTIAVGLVSLRRLHPRHRGALLLVAGGVTALALGSAVNWAKFRHPYMFPLELQEWTELSSRRRLALMVNGGTITGPQFVPTSLVTYFRPDGIRFVAYFPFVTFPAAPAHGIGSAVIDQAYRTGSLPAFSPLLVVLAVGGAIAAVRLRLAEGVRGLVVPVLGSIASGAGVMMYGYLAYRYTADFLPALVVCGAIGVVVLAGSAERRSMRWRRVVVGVVTVSALFGVAANGAAGIATSRVTSGGVALERYLEVQHGSGDPFGAADRLVGWSADLPDDAPTDRVQVVGACDGVYLATGDQYEPWVAVARRDLRVSVGHLIPASRRGLVPLIAFDGVRRRNITIEADGLGRLRFRVGEAFTFFASDWIDPATDEVVELVVRLDGTTDRFELLVGGVPLDGLFVNASEPDSNQIRQIVTPALIVPGERDLLGLRIGAGVGPSPKVCERLLAELG